MIANNILFSLNETECIIVQLECSLKEIDCCDESHIFFQQKNGNSVLLSNNAVYENMQIFNNLLKGVLAKAEVVHESIGNDIGYLYNQYSYYLFTNDLEKQGKFDYDVLDNASVWVGMRYYLWSSKDLVSWLYNDAAENIIFEVTPLYLYMDSRSQEITDYIPYKEWIKNYKPYLTRTISRKTAKQWFETTSAVIDQIESNISRWREQE